MLHNYVLMYNAICYFKYSARMYIIYMCCKSVNLTPFESYLYPCCDSLCHDLLGCARLRCGTGFFISTLELTGLRSTVCSALICFAIVWVAFGYFAVFGWSVVLLGFVVLFRILLQYICYCELYIVNTCMLVIDEYNTLFCFQFVICGFIW